MPLSELQLTREFIQAVREAADIVVLAREATQLQRSGRKLKGLCPLHREKTPSFYVDPDLGFFKCFGCGAGGDAISLHMRLTGDSFPQAIEELARRFGVPIPRTAHRRRFRGEAETPDPEEILAAAERYFMEQLERSSEALAYLQQRSISLELARRFRLGYAPPGWRNLFGALEARWPATQLQALGLIRTSEGDGKPYDQFRHRLIFPIRDAVGRLVGFAGRALGDEGPKYLNTAETERFHKGRLLFGLYEARRALRERRRALLVEGYFDLLGAVASGIEGVVASMGTALTPEQAQLLARYAEEVVVGYDADSAGEQAARRALPLLLRAGLAVYRLSLPAGEDPDSYRVREGPAKLIAAWEGAADSVLLELEQLTTPDIHRSPHARAKAARAFLSLVHAIEDPIVRSGYLDLGAKRLGLPVAELRKLAHVDRNQIVQAIQSPPPTDRRVRHGREWEAVRCLLHRLVRGEPLALPPNAPPPDAFLDPELGAIYQALMTQPLTAEPGSTALKELAGSLGTLADPVGLLADLVLEFPDTPGVGDLEGSLEDIRRRWLRERRKRLRLELEQAEQNGDSTRIEQLLRERERLNNDLFVSRSRGQSP